MPLSPLRRIRQDRSLTREALAFRAGVSVSTIRKLEVGQHRPSSGTALRLSRALEVPVDELLAHDEDGNEDAESVREEASRAAAAVT